jgi:hypothetical protein
MLKKATPFTVENKDWTYGKKVVVLASDYETVWAAYQETLAQLKKERERSTEWEKAARHARNMVGTIKVVK